MARSGSAADDEELTDEQLDAFADRLAADEDLVARVVAAAAEEGTLENTGLMSRLSRRDVLQGGAALGAGALLGGGGAMAAVDSTSAGSRSSGTIGTAANPLDVVAEDITADSINTVREVTTAANLQSALNNFAVVHIPEGTTLTVGKHTIPDNTTVIIDGTVKLGNGENSVVFANADLTNGNNNIAVVGSGTIDGNKANQADNASGTVDDQFALRFVNVDGLTVAGRWSSKLEIKNPFKGGINSKGPRSTPDSHDIQFAHLDVHDTDHDGVFTEGLDVSVRDCDFETIADTPVVIRNAQFAQVTGCDIRDTTGGRGVAVSRNSAFVSVDNNRIKDATVGVEVDEFGGTANPDRVSVSNNDIIIPGGSRGVRVANASRVWITGNYVFANNIPGPLFLAASSASNVHVDNNTWMDASASLTSVYSLQMTDHTSTFNGRMVNMLRAFLGGSATASISEEPHPVDEYDFQVDGDQSTAGGSATLQQLTIEGALRGETLRLWHVGDDTVTVQTVTNSGVSADGFKAAANRTLDANDEMAEYRYDDTHWREVTVNTS